MLCICAPMQASTRSTRLLERHEAQTQWLYVAGRVLAASLGVTDFGVAGAPLIHPYYTLNTPLIHPECTLNTAPNTALIQPL
jgi:hypothetical protein